MLSFKRMSISGHCSYHLCGTIDLEISMSCRNSSATRERVHNRDLYVAGYAPCSDQSVSTANNRSQQAQNSRGSVASGTYSPRCQTQSQSARSLPGQAGEGLGEQRPSIDPFLDDFHSWNRVPVATMSTAPTTRKPALMAAWTAATASGHHWKGNQSHVRFPMPAVQPAQLQVLPSRDERKSAGYVIVCFPVRFWLQSLVM